MLKKIILLIFSITIIACGEDNDDMILAEDVSNINLDEGIVFGFINPLDPSENLVYKYSNEGVFLSNNSPGISSQKEWTFVQCPYDIGSLTAITTADIPNVARGVRDIESTDIIDVFETNTPFYVLEYTTAKSDTNTLATDAVTDNLTTDSLKKTIQFTVNDSYNEEQINTYFSYIKESLAILTFSEETPLTSCPD